MFRAGFLLFVVAVGVHSVTAQGAVANLQAGAANTPPTALNFACNDQLGTISITPDGLDGYSSIYATGIRNDNDQGGFLCDVIDQPKDNSYKFEIKNCKPDNPVTVYIMKVPSQNIQNKGHGFVIGGDGVAAYTLECFKETSANNLPETFKVAKKIEVFLSSTIPTKAPEGRVYVDMSIRNNDGTTLAENTTVQLGTPLLVLIKGPVGPVYRVEKCESYNIHDKNNTIQLLSDKNVHHRELMSNFANGSPVTRITNLRTDCNDKFCIMSNLFAFRFKDSYSVTIECTIDVCRNVTSKGCDDSNANTFAGSKLHFQRRRRESNSQQHVLKSTIVVQDKLLENLESTSIGNMHRSPFYLIAKLAAVWVFRRFA